MPILSSTNLVLAVGHGARFYGWLFIVCNTRDTSTSFNSNQANQLGTTMNRVLCFWIFCVLANLAPICAAAMESTTQTAQLGPGDHTLVLQVGGRERRYVIHLPESYDGKHSVPVVIMFHGGGATPKMLSRKRGGQVKLISLGFSLPFLKVHCQILPNRATSAPIRKPGTTHRTASPPRNWTSMTAHSPVR